MSFYFSWKIRQFVDEHLKNCQVKKWQGVRENKVVVNKVYFFAVIDKLVFQINLIGLDVTTVCPGTED